VFAYHPALHGEVWQAALLVLDRRADAVSHGHASELTVPLLAVLGLAAESFRSSTQPRLGHHLP
jgi:hypothetical protein